MKGGAQVYSDQTIDKRGLRSTRLLLGMPLTGESSQQYEHPHACCLRACRTNVFPPMHLGHNPYPSRCISADLCARCHEKNASTIERKPRAALKG